MMVAMPIIRTLLSLAVLLLLVSAWLAAIAHGPAPARIVSAEMAPANVAVSAPLPRQPPADAAWQPLDAHVLAGWQGLYWLRWQVVLPDSTSPHLFTMSLRAASQLEWNGLTLAPNGVVGRTAAEERPGLIDVVRVLPAPQRTGPNELLVLASSHHQWPTLYSTDAGVHIIPADQQGAAVPWPWLIAALALGALAAASLYFFALQRGQPQSAGAPVLLALSAVGVALPIVEAWRPLLGYAYPWHGPRLLLLLALHVAAATLLPLYLARRFGVTISLGWRLAYLVLLLAVVILLPSFDGRGAAVLLLSLLVSIALLLRARQELEERWPIMTLLVVGALAMPLMGAAFLDGPYFLLLTVLMGYLLVRHAGRMRALDLHNARLREERARLSLQLLQRGIHPHWLMNTLTCLQELIEQSPTRASHLVEALASQFDQLRESSQHRCVPLEQELALCRNHLDIVSTALGTPVRLEVTGDDLVLQLPPGVLHAQIENALTHAGAAACAHHTLRLHMSQQNGRQVLELRSALGGARHRGQGTGTRYIEASLAAAFGERWTFSQGADGNDWCSWIELRCAS